jgi:hypothetical protein
VSFAKRAMRILDTKCREPRIDYTLLRERRSKMFDTSLRANSKMNVWAGSRLNRQ